MDYNEKQIKRNILEWLTQSEGSVYTTSFEFEIVENKEDRLFVNLTFEHCLAMIAVGKPEGAPFKFVEFDVLSIIDGSRVFNFYDTDDTTQAEVIEQLNKGVGICSRYRF